MGAFDRLRRYGTRFVEATRNYAPYAKFTESAGAGTGPEPATTPEPNLIFGFITLGGLMLGSKIKNKS